MSVIKTSELREGQKLATEVLYKNNVVLFKAGEKITGKHLKAFRAFGITEVEIENNSTKSKTQNAERLFSGEPVQLQDEVEFFFKFTDGDDEVIRELKKLSYNLKR